MTDWLHLSHAVLRRSRPRHRGICRSLGTSARALLTLLVAAVLLGLPLTSRGAADTASNGASAREWRVTYGGQSRVAVWAPDGRTLLVNRWGAVREVAGKQIVLSELWAVDLVGDGEPKRISGNAIKPAFHPAGHSVAYLSLAANGAWEARVQDLVEGEERVLGSADWHAPPIWEGDSVTFVSVGHTRQAATDGSSARVGAHPLPIATPARVAVSDNAVAWVGSSGVWAAGGCLSSPQRLLSDADVADLALTPDGRRVAVVTVERDLSQVLFVASLCDLEEPREILKCDSELLGGLHWAPDGETLAFTRTPLGTETASATDIWLASSTGDAICPLLTNDQEESLPLWSPDGRRIAFNRAGDVWVLDVKATLEHRLSQPGGRAEENVELDARLMGDRTVPPAHQLAANSGGPSPSLPALASQGEQMAPPATIRVFHNPANYYRADVPPGQIDVIDFETYVKRCVPVEVPALWPVETLRVQAIAARTYAWHYVLARVGESWDVSDWTDYQVMGQDEQRHERSDQATADTWGQYVAYQGAVIKAFYSAENSSPTRSAAGHPYIQAIDDPVGFGQVRRGHGWGMSQWGAQRWAALHGWSYQQILAHYYTDVTIELPAGESRPPIGALVLPWSDHYVTGDSLHLAANASDESGDVRAVGFYATTGPSTWLIFTDTMASDGWNAIWDVSGLADTATKGIELTVRVVDGGGSLQTQSHPVWVGLDRQPPASGSASVPRYVTDTTTVTITSISAVDPSPGSGVAAMAFSREDWAWEAEALGRTTGETITDPAALNGQAWQARAGVHSGGAIYGPYTDALAPGHAYRAYFRVKSSVSTTHGEVALLDVVDDGGARLLGLRRLRGTDFRSANTYQEFAVDFAYPDITDYGVEFRVWYEGEVDLTVDRVLVVSYPEPLTDTVAWGLTPGDGEKTVVVKFIDAAGNVSDDVAHTVTVIDARPPGAWSALHPLCWGGGASPTFSTGVSDVLSGLDVDSGQYRYSLDGGDSWSPWLGAACSGSTGTTDEQILTTQAIPFEQPGIANWVEFRIADVRGNVGSAQFTVLPPVMYIPVVLRAHATS
ncbi:MAG: SpoIID/LytB domain-containing protein [Chloroflexi bacterium]|nr:SpoIID/LytB domain-containing protein [Chloroflexota bacterium]